MAGSQEFVDAQEQGLARPRRSHSLLRRRDGELTRELSLESSYLGLGMLPVKREVEAVTNVVCGFCATGCGLNVHLKDGAGVALTPTSDYLVNRGMACPKGWESLRVLDSKHRATTPLLRGRSGRLEAVSWDAAMHSFTSRFSAIQAEYGRESVAFLSTGQIATEEMALLGALAKFAMGMVHGDGNTRQCMATAVTAYKQAFGFDAPPYTYADFEESDVIVLVGSNLCITHPIMWQRIVNNRHHPHVVVIDPRKTETAAAATTHLPIRPKADLMMMYGLANVLIRQGWVDRDFVAAHTRGFDAFADHVRGFSPDRVAAETGIDADRLCDLARLIHQGQRVSFWWTMGVNQSHEGVAVANAIINLALMTGNIGRPGSGANSITGQCNAMGSRLFSNTTGLLGGRDFLNDTHRLEVAEVLGIDSAAIPAANSWPYDRILEAIAAGKIKGLWIIATNPVHSWINQNGLSEILDRLDFLVVQDMYADTETALRADLLLAAAGWGEKEGTFINSERRIGLVKKVSRAPGEALSDFSIFKLIAHYWGCAQMFERWSSPEAVFALLARLSKGRPCDFSAIEDYRTIDEAGGIQWPYRPRDVEHRRVRESRLFEDGRFYHTDGRARFIVAEPRPMPERPRGEYPLLLLTGRGSAAQWHTQTRTRVSAILRKLYPARVYVAVNPVDARKYQIRNGSEAVIESRRGGIRAKVFVTRAVAPGQVFVPMHYRETNRLTNAVFDPQSRQPSFKACAVRIRQLSHWEEQACA